MLGSKNPRCPQLVANMLYVVHAILEDQLMSMQKSVNDGGDSRFVDLNELPATNITR